MNITIKRAFSNNDAIFGLPNVNVVVNDECQHIITHDETATHNVMFGDRVDEYQERYEVCNNCKATRLYGVQEWEFA